MEDTWKIGGVEANLGVAFISTLLTMIWTVIPRQQIPHKADIDPDNNIPTKL